LRALANRNRVGQLDEQLDTPPECGVAPLADEDTRLVSELKRLRRGNFRAATGLREPLLPAASIVKGTQRPPGGGRAR
jgi:hypothetical protein